MSDYNQLDKRALDAYIMREPFDVSACPACGEPIDYCQGHGEIGDPVGRATLARHDRSEHSGCHPDGCEDVDARDVRPV